ncbi:MAG: pyrroline-5-carboxylate reductase [Wenzhouxiangellaceae bacterium]|nr:pyrroline-5-carboxylate reductase [Wenzhouxiangellaceae bacterium]
MTIATIGAGNMARALIGGLLERGHPREKLLAADPDAGTRDEVADRFGIETLAVNADAAGRAGLVILAVKPQVIDKAAESIAGALNPDTIVVSVAAGTPIARLQRRLGEDQPIVRVMPNTPALYGAGATGLCASAACSDEQTKAARAVFEAVGKVFEIGDESLMDAVTAVSGSGPAYFFVLAEALAQAGSDAGLARDVAAGLAAQTAAGAGAMLAADEFDAAELRRRVTSPGGTTEAALNALSEAGFGDIVAHAVAAAIARGRELGAD